MCYFEIRLLPSPAFQIWVSQILKHASITSPHSPLLPPPPPAHHRESWKWKNLGNLVLPLITWQMVFTLIARFMRIIQVIN